MPGSHIKSSLTDLDLAYGNSDWEREEGWVEVRVRTRVIWWIMKKYEEKGAGDKSCHNRAGADPE